MVSGQAPNPDDAGGLPVLSPTSSRDPELATASSSGRAASIRPASRTSPPSWRAAATRGGATCRTWRTRRPRSPPPAGIRPSMRTTRTQTARRHRPVRRPPQPLRLLPLDHRLPDLPGERRRPEQARAGPALRVARPRTTRSSPRTSATTATTSPAPTASPAGWRRRTRSCGPDPRDPASPAYQRPRPAHRHLRRGREPRRRERLLRRAARPEHRSARAA